MALNYKYQLDPLREWFLKESPKEAVIDFKERALALLNNPDDFVELIQDKEFVDAMNKDVMKIEKSFEELETISNFIDYNSDEDEGITPFEYLIGSKVTVGRDTYEFIRSQFHFYMDIHAMIEGQRYSDPEALAPFLEALKKILESTCEKKENLRNHLDGYAAYMSELQSVEEANNSYAMIECMTEENYENFLKRGTLMINNLLEARKQMEGKEPF